MFVVDRRDSEFVVLPRQCRRFDINNKRDKRRRNVNGLRNKQWGSPQIQLRTQNEAI